MEPSIHKSTGKDQQGKSVDTDTRDLSKASNESGNVKQKCDKLTGTKTRTVSRSLSQNEEKYKEHGQKQLFLSDYGHDCETYYSPPYGLSLNKNQHGVNETFHDQSAASVNCHNENNTHSFETAPDSQTEKSLNFGIPDVSVNFERNGVVGYQSSEKREHQNSMIFHQQDGRHWNLASPRHHEIVLYILLVAVIALMMTVMHLYIRVQALERANNVFHGGKEPAAAEDMLTRRNLDIKELMEIMHRYSLDYSGLLNRQMSAGMNNPKPDDKDSHKLNENSVPRDGRNKDVQVESLHKLHQNKSMNYLIQSMAKHNKTVKEPDGLQNGPKGLSHETTSDFSSWKDMADVPFKDHSSDIEIGNVLPDVTSTLPDDTRFELSGVDKKRRSVRSAPNERVKDLCFNKQVSNHNKGCKCDIDSFVGNFYDHINYAAIFHGGHADCVPTEMWGSNVEICKDSTVLFPNISSTLPFYKIETNEKTTRKKRLLSDSTRGEFRVQKPGDYFVDFDITIVDEKEHHFLAVYVNNQAMLACPKGGFLCPDTNDLANIYRVCNISGLLELNEGDIVSIRTLKDNVRVRIQKTRKSYFKAVLLRPKKTERKKKA